MSKVIDNIEDIASIDSKANIASPTFTGTPLSTTPTNGDNSTKIATTAFVMQNGVPSGAIILWSGAVGSIPAGWYLCNGANGTPNLQDRFIVGAGSGYAVGATGGSKDAIVVSHSHTANHSHTGSTNTTGSHGHNLPLGGDGFTAQHRPQRTANWNDNAPVDANGNHSHTLTIDSASVTTSTVGSSETNANLPPYYALAYIMKS
jgi:microcystin-dependent protein